jgi:hypothetical protein
MRRLAFFLAIAAASCGGPPKTAPEPAEHSLATLAAQHIVVLPTYAVRIVPGLAWRSIGRPTDLQTLLDADIVSAFDERGLNKTWVFPAELEHAYRQNPTYASDPHNLAEEPLRSPALKLEDRLPEPFATQIRRLIALHDEVRYVLAPVELRFEKADSTGTRGRGVLRLVLLDARLSSVRWIGEFSSDTLSSYSPAVTAGIAAKLASAVSSQ